MGEAEFSAIRNATRNLVNDHRERYLKSGGCEGHILDMSGNGGVAFATHLLLKYFGRKSGRTLITPLCYGRIGAEVAIVASKGGSDIHPAWYLNLRHMEEIDFQIGTQAFRGTWREPEDAERGHIWTYMVECYPFYRDYQESTDRILPVITLKPNIPIPTFRFEEAEGWRE